MGYTIGILIIDFNPNINPLASGSNSNQSGYNCSNNSTNPTAEIFYGANTPLANKLFFGFAIVYVISAFINWWALQDFLWLDVIMIPEYLNLVEAVLYLWSSIWYVKQVSFNDYYTMGVHKIEITAASVDIVASFGWLMSWYRTYTRTLGRGFTLDDPDTMGNLCTTTASFIYITYNIQLNIHPEKYGLNTLYTKGDIFYFIGACYFLFGCLRDDNWFWFFPLAGQYGIASGKLNDSVNVQKPIQQGLEPLLITDVLCCRKRQNNLSKQQIVEENKASTYGNHLNKTFQMNDTLKIASLGKKKTLESKPEVPTGVGVLLDALYRSKMVSGNFGVVVGRCYVSWQVECPCMAESHEHMDNKVKAEQKFQKSGGQYQTLCRMYGDNSKSTYPVTVVAPKVLQVPSEYVGPWSYDIHWHAPLDNCTSSELATACCCYPCYVCSLMENAGEASYTGCLCPITLCGLRVKLRAALRIKGSLFKDCLVTSCCCTTSCAAMQMRHELDYRQLNVNHKQDKHSSTTN
ncbi:unnamed protein product [Didymodactylos carnosus]|uniref:Uncharacterized protein n=1 Tax=Didymodactylos carnosus TaxID=1234261 RepID=A0A813QCK2_9BILA|nr:unnamed protein product [Didymodactylos carnosus]CAF0765134.1 unnamed protein product [Didymodactylos carnosus]CAF3493594.1 unnamed protein product [Didymodactylos carnosus]CAF3546398.1 unnamed protein product [Didymodactylos carnosus]